MDHAISCSDFVFGSRQGWSSAGERAQTCVFHYLLSLLLVTLLLGHCLFPKTILIFPLIASLQAQMLTDMAPREPLFPRDTVRKMVGSCVRAFDALALALWPLGLTVLYFLLSPAGVALGHLDTSAPILVQIRGRRRASFSVSVDMKLQGRPNSPGSGTSSRNYCYLFLNFILIVS